MFGSRLKFRLRNVLVVLTFFVLISFLVLLNQRYVDHSHVYILDTWQDLTPGPDPGIGKKVNSGELTWGMEGWTYYENLTQGQGLFPKVSGQNVKGVWTPSEGILSSWIRFENFQGKSSMNRFSIAIGIAVRITGNLRFEVRVKKWKDGDRETEEVIHLDILKNSSVEDVNGFCNAVIDEVPFLEYGLVDLIEIRPIFYYDVDDPDLSRSRFSFLAIDKIVVSIGSEESQRSLLYSLIPNNWCQTQDDHYYLTS